MELLSGAIFFILPRPSFDTLMTWLCLTGPFTMRLEQTPFPPSFNVNKNGKSNDVYKSLDGRYAQIGPVRRSDLLEE